MEKKNELENIDKEINLMNSDIKIFLFFCLIEIHSTQGWTVPRGMELQEKEAQKD